MVPHIVILDKNETLKMKEKNAPKHSWNYVPISLNKWVKCINNVNNHLLLSSKLKERLMILRLFNQDANKHVNQLAMNNQTFHSPISQKM